MAQTLNSDAGPVLQLSFDNGWTASVVIGRLVCSLGCWPTVHHSESKFFEIAEQEASDDEVAAFFAEVRTRPTYGSANVPGNASSGNAKADRATGVSAADASAKALASCVRVADQLYASGMPIGAACEEACTAEPHFASVAGLMFAASRSKAVTWAKSALAA